MTSHILGANHLQIYAFMAILSGVGFLLMGAAVWGGCYVIGLGFLAASPLLAMFPEWATFWFGLIWGVSLVVIGLRYWRIGAVPPIQNPRA